MGTVGRIRYRIWQFWQAVKARPFTEKSKLEISETLSEKELALFHRQKLSAQQHSYRVMQTLKSAGQNDPDLLAAALLHDVGMADTNSSWWHRPIVVLAQATVPKQSAKWAEADLIGWRRPFMIRAKHPEWGARAAAQCGSSERTVALIRRHQDPISDDSPDELGKLLAQLQWADNNN